MTDPYTCKRVNHYIVRDSVITVLVLICLFEILLQDNFVLAQVVVQHLEEGLVGLGINVCVTNFDVSF